MESVRAIRGLQLVELNGERVRAALVRIDEMSKEELREPVGDEPQIFVDAAEGIIACRRSSGQRTGGRCRAPWKHYGNLSPRESCHNRLHLTAKPVFTG
jgi:hypothetical protein